MLRTDASALFRFVLLSSAVGACGGSIDTIGDGGSSGSTSSGSTSSSGGSTSSSSSGSTSSSSGGSTSGGSTSSSGGSTSSGGSSGSGSCVNGTMVPSDDLCCPAGTSCPNITYGDAGTHCAVDCDRVCALVAPAATGGSRSCNWQGNDQMLDYLCGGCGVGRVPGDTELCPLGETVAERLARQAYYEAASVIAFERLTSALEQAGAPIALVDRARAAAKDEARHATLFAALAARHGAAPIALTYRAAAPSFFELAVENATEGCVRETFGALVTLHQAAYAESAVIREAFAAIAEDEAEHAALSWELKAWFDTQLSAAERATVQQAHLHALALARRDAASTPDAPGLALGLPVPDRAQRMLDTLMSALAAG